jgi:hypothetical protein
MKKQAYSIIAIASLLIVSSVAPAYAQSGAKMKATIPFDFALNDKTIPAGDYIVEPVQFGSQLALRMRDVNGHTTATVPTRPVQASEFQAEARLVFHRYGDQYFLSEAWTAGERTGHEITKSRAEAELAKSASAPKRYSVLATSHQR